jgi:hypothetical protein
MCTGYSKDIFTWTSQEAQDQRDMAVMAWGQAFESPGALAEPRHASLPPATGQAQRAVGTQAKPANTLPRPVIPP